MEAQKMQMQMRNASGHSRPHLGSVSLSVSLSLQPPAARASHATLLNITASLICIRLVLWATFASTPTIKPADAPRRRPLPPLFGVTFGGLHSRFQVGCGRRTLLACLLAVRQAGWLAGVTFMFVATQQQQQHRRRRRRRLILLDANCAQILSLICNYRPFPVKFSSKLTNRQTNRLAPATRLLSGGVRGAWKLSSR